MFTSAEILNKEDLYELQDTFSSSGIPFKYQLTKGEYEWANFIKGKYCISDFVLENTDKDLILSFNCPYELSEALEKDDSPNKAIMLSDETALQRLFFWLSNND